MDTLPEACRCRVSVATGWSCVSVLILSEIAGLICNFCPSVACEQIASVALPPRYPLYICLNVQQTTWKTRSRATDYSTQASLIDVYSVVGSVMCMDDVLTVTKGATTVFHLASITDNRLFPDHPLERTVNVQGECDVIDCCTCGFHRLRQSLTRTLAYSAMVAIPGPSLNFANCGIHTLQLWL